MRTTSQQISIEDLGGAIRRFHSKVRVSDQGCWLWTGCKLSKTGYGRLNVKGTVYYAHRVALHIKGIAIPDGMNALHRCNNPSCVNPDHLYVGTQAENMQQCSREGRAKGQDKPCCPKCGGAYSRNSQGRRICLPCKVLSNRIRLQERARKAVV